MFLCTTTKKSAAMIAVAPSIRRLSSKIHNCEEMTTEHINDETIKKIDFVSIDQQNLIAKVWDHIADHMTLFQNVYLQIFMHKPSLKHGGQFQPPASLPIQSLFPFRHLPVESLKLDEYFNRQCNLMQNFVTQLVDFMRTDQRSKFDNLCTRVGRRHAHLTVVDFEPDWWHLFISATLDQLQTFFQTTPLSSSSSTTMTANQNIHESTLSKIGHVIFHHSSTNSKTVQDKMKESWRNFLEYTVETMSAEFYRTKGKLEAMAAARAEGVEDSDSELWMKE
uniref:Globin family profile domain-containing protein n=1 Tax=Romanomermis culicivorax TaxID=13658 RepID=A0A915HVS6_ROMCU